jgi:hypothetical protein
MNERQENLWQAVHPLWMKYCGISDEYKMLRDRWIYHLCENNLVLPNLKDVLFKRLDDLIESQQQSLDNIFKTKFLLRRNRLNVIDEFQGTLKDIEEIRRFFCDLSQYVGLLKIAFFQRTASREISHAISGVPHSPERTIGNEIFYVAADQLTKKYLESFKIDYWDWDNFITFLPPIQTGYFYGAVNIPFPRQKLYHISMSEEQKFFIGAYMHLSHELAHSVTRWPHTGTFPPWFESLRNFSLNYTNTSFKNHNMISCLEKCPISIINEFPIDGSRFFHYQFEQFICDLISCKIGGIISQIAFIDDALESGIGAIFDILVRSIGVYTYYKKDRIMNEDLKQLGARIMRIKDSLEEMEISSKCIDCWFRFGGCFGKATHYFNGNFQTIIHNDRQNFTLEQEMEIITSLRNPPPTQPLFSSIIKDDFKISIKDKEIEEKLIKGIPCLDVDPRKIIYCFYKSFGRSKGVKRPSHITTVYSIAFNEYKEEK